jgi:hypothetical protein
MRYQRSTSTTCSNTPMRGADTFTEGLADSKVKCNTQGFNESGWNAGGC